MSMHAPASRTRTRCNATLIAAAASACIGLAAPSHVFATDTVTYTYTMPDYTVPNDFLFTTVGTLSVPYFNTLGGALVLETATFSGLFGSYTYAYSMTNNGATTAAAVLQVQRQLTGTGPGGVAVFTPPFGGHSSGPFAAPGQTVINSPQITGGGGQIRTVSTTDALPFTGRGNYDLNVTMSLPVTIQNPAQFSAVYLSSSFAGATVSVTYGYRCDGDTNGDHHIDTDDLLAVIGSWGFQSCFPQLHCAADIAPTPQPDFRVNTDDLLRVISRWGECPQGPGK